MMEQVLVQFGDVHVEPFLQHEEIGSAPPYPNSKGILSDLSKEVYLKVELASVVDYGKPFVTATYTLEGDGPLVLTCFEVIEEVQASICSSFTPNVDAVANTHSSGTPHRLVQLKAYSEVHTTWTGLFR